MRTPRLLRPLREPRHLLTLISLLALLCLPALSAAQQAPETPAPAAAEVPADDDSAEAPADDDSAEVADDDSAEAGDDDSADAAQTGTAVSGGETAEHGDDDSAAAAHGEKKEKVWWKELGPIAILLVVIAFVIGRLPKVEGLGHTDQFRMRRVLNWLPLGLTYAFFYMGRYNLKVSKHAFEKLEDLDGAALMGNEDFSLIFGIGTAVYGLAFVINGPLTDRIGGKKAMMIGAAGIFVINAVMGLASMSVLYEGAGYTFLAGNFVPAFAVLYSINMYFQSFGAVAIVKVNAPWFHVKERGVFGAIFGILISLGLYFAYDWSYKILGFFEPDDPTAPNLGLAFVFFVPAVILGVLWVIDLFAVRNTPGEAGLKDFHTGDATAGDDSPRLSVFKVFGLLLKNPVILTIAFVEFCSGFLRQAIMQWFRTFASQTDDMLHLEGSFVYDNWGMVLCCAGILGGVFAGVLSDRIFGSRRGPVAVMLYAVMLVCAIVMTFTYKQPVVAMLVVLMSLAVIGVHGMLSGTASMDFGGAKNAGTAVGLIDGFVYLGTAVMSGTYYFILPREGGDTWAGSAADPNNWWPWPVSMIPIALIGLVLAMRLWNAKPKSKGGGGH